MNKQVYGMLGLCARAGKIVSGAQGAEGAVKARHAFLVLMDAQSSALAQKSMADLCANRGVKMILLEEQMLGDAIGKPGRLVAAITDESFASRIGQLLKEDSCR